MQADRPPRRFAVCREELPNPRATLLPARLVSTRNALSADLIATRTALTADIVGARTELHALAANAALIEHRVMTRLDGLVVVVAGLLFGALHLWPPH